MIAIGQVLGERYRVDGVLGAGGMGIVLSAHDTVLGRAVCIKLPHQATTEVARRRLIREAQLASRLRGEHVCRIHDVVMLADDTPCLVMERIDGRDLDAEVAARGPLPIREAIAVIRQVCTAMIEAHALGIVHLDLKPQNLVLARQLDGAPLLKVVDFGIARALGDAGNTTMAGSPSFMAPEQGRRGRVDARADVYALGAVMYFMVTARPPLVASDAIEALVELQTATPTNPARLRAELPQALDHVIMRCLERDPSRRFADANALDLALASATRGGDVGLLRHNRPRRYAFALATMGVIALALLSSTSLPPPDRVRSSVAETPRDVATAPSLPDPATLIPREVVGSAVPSSVAPPLFQAPSSRPRALRASRPKVSEPMRPESAPSSDSVASPALAAKCRTDDFLCQFGGPR